MMSCAWQVKGSALCVQALGLDGMQYDDSLPPITGSQINEATLEDALQLVPASAAKRQVSVSMAGQGKCQVFLLALLTSHHLDASA